MALTRVRAGRVDRVEIGILLLVVALLVWLTCTPASAQVSTGTARHVRWGLVLPLVCNPATGDVFFLVAAGPVGTPYFCSATNTWTQLAAGPMPAFPLASSLGGLGASLSAAPTGCVPVSNGGSPAVFGCAGNPVVSGIITFGNADSAFTPNLQGWTFAYNSINRINTSGSDGHANLEVTLQSIASGEGIWGVSYVTGNAQEADGVTADGVITGNNSTAIGLQGQAWNFTGTGGTLSATQGQVVVKSGSVSTGAALRAISAFIQGGGTLINGYGLLVQDQIAATNNWAIKTGLGQVSFGDTLSVTGLSTLTGGAVTGSGAYLQVGARSTDPTCAATGDIGKLWFDNTSSATTVFKVCVEVASTPTWVTK